MEKKYFIVGTHHKNIDVRCELYTDSEAHVEYELKIGQTKINGLDETQRVEEVRKRGRTINKKN